MGASVRRAGITLNTLVTAALWGRRRRRSHRRLRGGPVGLRYLHDHGLGGNEDDNPGGAGTVYLRDPDESNGTLIIDAGSGGGGVTPLGLPGQSSFAIPDTVVIRGARTDVQPEHTGLVLEFQNSLTVDQSGTLNVEAADFITDKSATVLDGATLNVSGDYAAGAPARRHGGQSQCVGDLTLGVPLQVTNASVSVDGTLTSTVPQTITGGTITTDHLVAPTWSLVQGAVLTSFASTATQMHKLEVKVDGSLSVDATSKIDVTGKGYLVRPYYRQHDSGRIEWWRQLRGRGRKSNKQCLRRLRPTR